MPDQTIDPTPDPTDARPATHESGTWPSWLRSPTARIAVIAVATVILIRSGIIIGGAVRDSEQPAVVVMIIAGVALASLAVMGLGAFADRRRS